MTAPGAANLPEARHSAVQFTVLQILPFTSQMPRPAPPSLAIITLDAW